MENIDTDVRLQRVKSFILLPKLINYYYLTVTSLTADIKCDSIASFPGHLITSVSGNFCRLNFRVYITNSVQGLHYIVITFVYSEGSSNSNDWVNTTNKM